MTNRVIGPGVTLPPPQALYPAVLQNDAYTAPTNTVTLAPGDSIQIPAGDWMVDLGKYSILEYQDPTNFPNVSQTAGVWRPIRVQRGTYPIRSDGFNFRISNLLGCAVGAVVTGVGHNYVQASTTVAPSVGNSTWLPVVGGGLGAYSIVAAGSGYGLPPIVFIPIPPAPGVPASAHATLSSGTLATIVIDNMGAGYVSLPNITILPNPFDPNQASIVQATAVASLTGSGAVMAVLCTNPGATVASTMTLTITGVGTSATASPTILQTISSLVVAAAGTGSQTTTALTTIGGVPTGNVFTNPAIENTDFLPRPAQIGFTTSGGGAVSAPVIIDGGMFLAAPSPILQTYGGGQTTSPTSVTLTFGSTADTVLIQPL